MSEPLYEGKPVREWTSFQYDKYKRPEGMPNIVLLMTDEQRHDTIGTMGHSWMKTPNLDRLCAEGTAFRNAHSPNPVCVPARHNLLIGLPARYHGMHDNIKRTIDRGIPRLPQLLADAGYFCGEVGKMHFLPARTHHGFHSMQIMGEIPTSHYDDDYLTYLRENGYERVRNIHGIRNLLYWQPQRSIIPEEHHGTTWVGDRCVEFIRANAWRPFFLWAGWIAPHPPQDVPEPWADLYTGADIPMPAAPCDNPHRVLERSAGQIDYQDADKVRRVRELYYGAVSHVDHNVGKILDTLDACGIADNTLVVYTSDHGEMLGDLGGWSKSMPNDQAVRIPMIMRMPGRVPAGTVRSDFADLNDVLPTVLDAAGIEYPPDAGLELAGDSLLKTEAESRRDRSVHYSELQSGYKRWVMMRDHRWKFVHWYDGREQLWDLDSDPYEQHDLMSADLSGEARGAFDRLRARLIAHEERWGLEGHIESGDFVAFEEPPNSWPVESPGVNWQFQAHWHALPREEQAAMQTECEEILAATAKEPALDLARLNLDYYLSAGGDPELVKKVRGKSAD